MKKINGKNFRVTYYPAYKKGKLEKNGNHSFQTSLFQQYYYGWYVIYAADTFVSKYYFRKKMG